MTCPTHKEHQCPTSILSFYRSDDLSSWCCLPNPSSIECSDCSCNCRLTPFSKLFSCCDIAVSSKSVCKMQSCVGGLFDCQLEIATANRLLDQASMIMASIPMNKPSNHSNHRIRKSIEQSLCSIASH